MIVRLSSAERRDHRWQDVRSASDGTFELGPVAAGSYRLRAERRGLAPHELETPVIVDGRDVDDVVIRLLPGARITGRVVGLELEDLARVEVAAGG